MRGPFWFVTGAYVMASAQGQQPTTVGWVMWAVLAVGYAWAVARGFEKRGN